MTKRPAARTGVVVSVFVALVTAGVLTSVQGSDGDHAATISVSSAENLLGEAVRLAQAGDYAGLCQSVALNSRTCDFLLEAARERGLSQWGGAPRIVYVTRPSDDRLTLHLEGKYPDGTTYFSEFTVVGVRHDGDEWQLRSVTPVYWSPMLPAGGKCTQAAAGHVECGGDLEVAPPHPSF
ncbi:hypothetical protein [Amycolatopsis arida]|uniref:hypothetical protein n=1 Tax=Amycolatopsis arida TaxID=587909 RepID=UPI001064CCE2|nr:hypothetical protein [Amycolatopsis arida]